MTADFAGSTAHYYRYHRRDVPEIVVDELCRALNLSGTDRVVDLGCGTGQLSVPLAGRVREVVAVDPEPAMLAQLTARNAEAGIANVTTVRAADSDLPALTRASTSDPFAAVTVATALHWMDAERVFGTARDRVRPGGGIAVVTQGLPLWLQDTAWARVLRAYLETWAGPLSCTCGTDSDTFEQRRQLLKRVGFPTVLTFTHTETVVVDTDYVIGHLYSTMSEHQINSADRPRFEAGLRSAIGSHVAATEPLIDLVHATLLIGRV